MANKKRWIDAERLKERFLVVAQNEVLSEVWECLYEELKQPAEAKNA